MDERQMKRDTERVIREVLKLVEKQDAVGKQEFEAVNRKIMEFVSQNAGVSMDQVIQKMRVVIQALPKEYGSLDENKKSWEALIAYLYMKYLKELGDL
jgi:hypothetical protein